MADAAVRVAGSDVDAAYSQVSDVRRSGAGAAGLGLEALLPWPIELQTRTLVTEDLPSALSGVPMKVEIQDLRAGRPSLPKDSSESPDLEAETHAPSDSERSWDEGNEATPMPPPGLGLAEQPSFHGLGSLMSPYGWQAVPCPWLLPPLPATPWLLPPAPQALPPLQPEPFTAFEPTPALQVAVSDDGATVVAWLVDARKLSSKDTRLVSPAFGLLREQAAPFRIMLTPKPISSRKGGQSFQRAQGKGGVQLKCESQLADGASGKVTLRVSMGRQASKDIMHDFAMDGVACLGQAWDFSKAVDKERQGFFVHVEVQP